MAAYTATSNSCCIVLLNDFTFGTHPHIVTIQPLGCKTLIHVHSLGGQIFSCYICIAINHVPLYFYTGMMHLSACSRSTKLVKKHRYIVLVYEHRAINNKLISIRCRMSPTVGTLAEVAEALVAVPGARHSNEAIPTVHQQSTISNTAHEHRVTGHSRIQSRRIGDVVAVQDVVHR